MASRRVINKADRVVLPKPVRDDLQLEPGDALELENGGAQITLRPVRGVGPLQMSMASGFYTPENLCLLPLLTIC
jgi:AbrB family looped-hinge helix DNA binding protein